MCFQRWSKWERKEQERQRMDSEQGHRWCMVVERVVGDNNKALQNTQMTCLHLNVTTWNNLSMQAPEKHTSILVKPSACGQRFWSYSFFKNHIFKLSFKLHTLLSTVLQFLSCHFLGCQNDVITGGQIGSRWNQSKRWKSEVVSYHYHSQQLHNHCSFASFVHHEQPTEPWAPLEVIVSIRIMQLICRNT